MKLDDFGFNFHKNFMAGIVEASWNIINSYSYMETALLKELLFLALVNILHKITNAVGLGEDWTVSVPY